MTDYTPSLVYEHEVRNSFTPPLDYNDITKADILLKIEAVEDYIKSVYFGDSMPSRIKGRIPALLLAMSKVLKGNPSIVKKYGIVESLSLGDYKVSYALSGKGDHVIAYESAESWEQMALKMLKRRGGENFWGEVVLVND